MRLTISLSRSSPNARLICWAMRGQPYRGFRCFISTMARMTSLDGPLGPRFLPPRDEYRSRYFRFFMDLLKASSVDGLMMIAGLTRRRGFRKIDRKPRTVRSFVVRLGYLWRDLLWIISCCFRSRFSAVTARLPPGRVSLAREVSRS